MSEKDKFIDNIVKGMMDNKRSLVQRYGKDAESVAFAFATKKWDEKMKKENLTEVKIGDTIKHTGSGVKFVVDKINGVRIEGKIIDVGNGMVPGVKLGARNKTNSNLIGKTYFIDNQSNESKLTEMIQSAYKKIISERNQVVNSKSYIETKSLKENIKELTDEEYKIAKEFATKKGGKLAATGADDKTLYIAVTMPGKTDEVEFKLDKTGKELK